jgi:hypothetical protein
MYLHLSRADTKLRLFALAPISTSTRDWVTPTWVAVGILTFPHGGVVSIHPVPKTCTLSDGEMAVALRAQQCLPDR